MVEVVAYRRQTEDPHQKRQVLLGRYRDLTALRMVPAVVLSAGGGDMRSEGVVVSVRV